MSNKADTVFEQGIKKICTEVQHCKLGGGGFEAFFLNWMYTFWFFDTKLWSCKEYTFVVRIRSIG